MVAAAWFFTAVSVISLVILVTRVRRPPPPPEERWPLLGVAVMGLLFIAVSTVVALFLSFGLVMSAAHTQSSTVPYTVLLLQMAVWWLLGLGLTVRKIFHRVSGTG